MEKAERDLIVEQLAQSRERLLQVTGGLTREQQTYRAAEGRWSVADCVEHVAIVEDNILRRIQKILEGPPEPQRRPEAQGKEEIILARVPARETRVQGPPQVMPTGRWSNFDALIRQFESTRERSLRFAAVTQADLRCHFFPHPFLGLFDCYQWLLFLGTHCERHVRQMEEVMADPGFPRASQASA